jgi:capsular polysaccharide biosynthesis protein
MRLQDILAILRRRGWVILIFALATTLAAIGASKVQTPLYRSSIRISVNPARADLGLSETISRLLRNYGEHLTTRRMAEIAIDKLKLRANDPTITPEKLRDGVRVNAQLASYIIQVQVDDKDPNRARDIARVLAQVFVEEQTQRYADIDPQDRIRLSVLDEPTPARQVRPQTKVNALGGLALGLLIGGTLAILWELTNDTIKVGEDAEQMGLPVLGIIPVAR